MARSASIWRRWVVAEMASCSPPGAAHQCHRLTDLASFESIDWDAALDWLVNVRRIPALAERQIEAVQAALTNRVTVLTGGPGTGKSTTVRSIVTLARAKRARVLLVAPTGRAAKRLERADRPLRHGPSIDCLKLQPGGSAAFDEDNPLDADLLVVDESSMLDVYLFNTLVRALPIRLPSSCSSVMPISCRRSAPATCCTISSPAR